MNDLIRRRTQAGLPGDGSFGETTDLVWDPTTKDSMEEREKGMDMNKIVEALVDMIPPRQVDVEVQVSLRRRWCWVKTKRSVSLFQCFNVAG